MDHCDQCGVEVNEDDPGASWAHTWRYDFDRCPVLLDPVWRCWDCTEIHGRPITNCVGVYSGRNPITEEEGA